MTVRPTSQHAVVFIFITVLIDMIGFGLIIPVMPELIEELTGLQADDAAILGAWLMVSYAAMQFVFAPIVGGLSDRFGRKPVLLAALAGFTIDYVIMGFAPVFWLLLVGRILAGIFGASYSTANAFIADITPPEQRAARFGLIGAAFGVGFTLGPAIGGFLGDNFGPRAPFFAAAILAGANFVYGLIVLPETLKPENRRKFDIRRANPLGSLVQMRKHPAVLVLMCAIFLMLLGHSVYPAIWSYYTDFKFGWGPREIGLSLMAVGLSSAIVQGGLTRILVPKLGEWRAITISLILAVTAYALYGFATTGWMVYAIIVFAALGGIGQPALQGVMSRIVPPNAQGELQGAMTSLQSLSMIIGPLVMSRIFSHYSEEGAAVTFPGAPFLLASALTLIALMIGLSARRHDPGPAVKPAVPPAQATDPAE
ncbi:TCR/Tet family MFS transporter [uncultured Maricaulis sp.]|uniref:TCR/Tet family MFS transporter n=1 Tax=uncultured Maricaulis sp. TaxID=174710 RepID=UPI0026384DE3|nr:TCR/Tet family MFS transporter [uncultured Maricaulis sp.]